MKLKNTLALSLAAVMAAGLTACGSGADTASAASPAADSTAAAAANRIIDQIITDKYQRRSQRNDHYARCD